MENYKRQVANHQSPITNYQLQKGMVIGCYVGVMAFLIHSLVDFGLYVQGIATYVWLFMGMVLAARDYKSYPGGYRQAISYKLANPLARTGVAILIVLIIIFLMVTAGKPLAAERHFQQSSIYLSRGAAERGVGHLKEAIRLNPRKAAYYFRLGNIYQEKGWLDKAINQYRQAIEHDPFMPHYHSTLGKVLWDKARGRDEGLMEEAVRKFEKARDLFPARAKYRVLLGRIYELKGRREEARQEYNKALRLNPSLEEAEAVRMGMERLETNSP